jgi:serpin B
MTSEQTFYGLSKDSKVKLMGQKAFLPYAEMNGFQMIQLPYEGQRYSMYVILPPDGSDLNKLIPKATETVFNSALDALQMQEVRFFMPRFKVETSMLLNEPLQNMGIKTAFTSAADFSSIAEMGPLVVDQVKQKCYVDVSEKGTEAAAVTAIQIRLTSARPVAKLPVMRVDRPFIFLIADSENQNILFAGKIVNL